MVARLEEATGRYVNLMVQGRLYRIYFEEAGRGIPLLCLHTAGAEGSQYRHLLNDPDITRNYRVIAFDMPWHGKSLPPVGYHLEEYRLTTDLYVATIMAVCQELELEQPVIMGCSMGGRIVLQLALAHAPGKRRSPGALV
jgi:pimeloyl-ACP methyl ester carboxylesterase